MKINKLLSLFNLRIEKISKNENIEDVLRFLLSKLNIDTVLDIGANEGQFAKKLRNLGYKEKIISEDDEHRAEDAIQVLTDKYIKEIDNILNEKEKDLMEV